MTVALAARNAQAEPERLRARAERLDQRAWYLAAPVADATEARSLWRAAALHVVGVGMEGTLRGADAPGRLERAARCAATLGAGAVVAEAGRRDGDEVARAVEAHARLLHGALAAGVPLAVAVRGRAQDLLDLEATGWLLESLAGLGLWIDPVALAAATQGGTPEPWLDAYGRRCTGVLVHGGASAHPAEALVDWRALAETLGRRLPWVLEMPSDVEDADVRDALAWLRTQGVG